LITAQQNFIHGSNLEIDSNRKKNFGEIYSHQERACRERDG
jgi:hypothetical protein